MDFAVARSSAFALIVALHCAGEGHAVFSLIMGASAPHTTSVRELHAGTATIPERFQTN